MTATRRVGIAAALVALALAASAAGTHAQETDDYVVAFYELTFDLRSDSPDADVTMDLTYRIRSGVKSEGFKYVANYEPEDYSGVEDGGRPIRVSVEHLAETRVRWQFTPSGPGEKRVSIRFTLPDVVTGTLAQDVLRAPWAGIFRVPVENAVYRVVMPDGWEEERLSVRPETVRRTRINGRVVYEMWQQPLEDEVLSLTATPGFVEHTFTASSGSGGLPTGLILILGILGVAIVAAIIGSSKRVRRGGPSNSSSCAGGSSCSSSCGGGGCGGGCGG